MTAFLTSRDGKTMAIMFRTDINHQHDRDGLTFVILIGAAVVFALAVLPVLPLLLG